MTKYCHFCKGNKNEEHICQSNFKGGSGNMESAEATEIFQC